VTASGGRGQEATATSPDSGVVVSVGVGVGVGVGVTDGVGVGDTVGGVVTGGDGVLSSGAHDGDAGVLPAACVAQAVALGGVGRTLVLGLCEGVGVT
jgi:hypothetical protein